MDRRTLKTKRSLQIGLFELLRTKSVDEISVTELSEQADIARRTFYLHYDNIMEIFDDYLQELSDQLENNLKKRSFDAETLVTSFNQIFSEYQAEFRIICLNHRQDTLVNKLEEMLFRTFKELLSLSESKIGALKYITSGIINVYVFQINHPDELSLVNLSEEVRKLLENDLDILRS